MTVIISISHPKRSDIIHFGSRFKRLWTGQLHWCSLRDRGIHIRLHPNSINRDSGIEFPEVWMPTIRQHNSFWYQNRLLMSRVQRKSVLQPAIRASCSQHVLAHKSFQLTPKPFLISGIDHNPSVRQVKNKNHQPDNKIHQPRAIRHNFLYTLLREVCSSINANNALDQNPPTISEVCDTPFTTNHGNADSSTQ